MIITINHPPIGTQKTYSTAQVEAAAALTYVENNNDFASGDITLFGKYGEEKTERVVLTGKTNSNVIDHSTGPIFAHPVRTPITQLMYDQAEISRGSSLGGSYSVVTTIDLNFDEDLTLYNDTGGTSSSWYKIRYKNSSSGDFSDYSDEVQGTGYTEDSLRSMVDEVLGDFGDSLGQSISRETIRGYLNAGVRKLVSVIIKNYPDYRTTYTTQALISGTSAYTLPSYFLAFKRVDVNFDGNDTAGAYKATFEGEEQGDPRATYTQSNPRISIRGTSLILKPTPTASGGYIYMWYWDYPVAMNDDTDEHGLPYGARDILVTFALYRTWMTRDQEKASSYKSYMNDQIDDYMEFVGQQRQMMNKRMVNINFGSDMYE